MIFIGAWVVRFISIGMFPSATIADRRALDSANAMFKGIIEMEPSNTYAGSHKFSPIPSEHASHGFPNSRAAHQKGQLWTPYGHRPASPVPPRAPEIILRFIRRAVVLLYAALPSVCPIRAVSGTVIPGASTRSIPDLEGSNDCGRKDI